MVIVQSTSPSLGPRAGGEGVSQITSWPGKAPCVLLAGGLHGVPWRRDRQVWSMSVGLAPTATPRLTIETASLVRPVDGLMKPMRNIIWLYRLYGLKLRQWECVHVRLYTTHRMPPRKWPTPCKRLHGSSQYPSGSYAGTPPGSPAQLSP
jgi:hypothetical protein